MNFSTIIIMVMAYVCIYIGTEIIVRPRHVRSSVNLEDLLNSSGKFQSYFVTCPSSSCTEWSIVNTCFPVLCKLLPDDYQSTIEKLRLLPQFLGTDQQQQLNSLIPTTLTDVKMINEKIITFIVITMSFSSSSGGMQKLCDIMDELTKSTSCMQSGEHLL